MTVESPDMPTEKKNYFLSENNYHHVERIQLHESAV